MGLASKVKKTLQEEGVKPLLRKAKNYTIFQLENKKHKTDYRDILFINGCTLPHPERYRVDHQIEQLECNGLTVDKVFYENLDIEKLKHYRGFVFFRCPITEKVSNFIDKAHYFNKKVFFDVDDLVIDRKYTDTIPFVMAMSKEDKKTYDDGVLRMGETLKKCDFLITSTTALGRELKKYGKEVFVNKNVASEKMVELSLNAKGKTQKAPGEIHIGYLSGSITHNPDFDLIKAPLLKIMQNYGNVYLDIVGYLDLPKEFEPFESRIIKRPFGNWQSLPSLMANLDINLAPICKSTFNEAKSENKWTEAALVKLPTVASNFGAFKEVIKDGKTGLLANSESEWYEKIKLLVEQAKEREKIGNAAFEYAIKNYVTTYSGLGLTNFIESKLARNFAFVLPSTNISGGVNVVIKHCNILRENGHDVSIINSDKDDENIINNDGEINVVSIKKHKISARFDSMVATLFTTLKFVKSYPEVKNRLYFVQNFETDFGNYGSSIKREANSTYHSLDNIKYITISTWCKKWLKDNYGKDAKYAPNGIELSDFHTKKRDFGKKIKILVEGNSADYYKNVDESFKIVNQLDREKFEINFLSYQGEPKPWYHVDNFYHKIPHDEISKIYEESDILIKSSILESFSYPPLEMMATGGFCVVVPNEGNVEYLKDGYNCLFYEQGNVDDAVDKINQIVKDGALREKLLKNSQKTVSERDWKKLEKQILDLYL